MNVIKNYGWAFYLGISLGLFADVSVFDWQFYAIVIPIAALESLKETLK